MDIGLSAPVDLNDCHGLYTYTLKSTTEDFSINELGDGMTAILSIQDDTDGLPGSKPANGKRDLQKKDEATSKCFSGSITALKGKMKDGADAITCEESKGGDTIKSVDPPCRHSPYLPTTLKPVSAMKGSREKRGVAPPTKLTVKWAPDVYDPIPTSVCHTVTNKKPQSRSKKHSKNKQNGGKSSRGSKYKDKKQGRKHGGSSSTTGFKSPQREEDAVDFCEPPPTSMDFHVGNPDQFCGSSFLKRYGMSLHLSSVAEAT